MTLQHWITKQFGSQPKCDKALGWKPRTCHRYLTHSPDKFMLAHRELRHRVDLNVLSDMCTKRGIEILVESGDRD